MRCNRIIIVGGGFAGVRCAKTLRRRLRPSQCEIVLFDRENHMVFHPMLPEVAGASIRPDAVAAPLRQMLAGVRCRTERVTGIELAESSIRYEDHEGRPRTMAYDHVVVAVGSPVNLGRIPGMADHAFALKTVGDAMALRAHVMQQLERAEVCDDPVRRRWYLSFVIVGGGYSGVETAGEINDLVRGSRRFFPAIADQDITVRLIQSRDELLPEVSPTLRSFARSKMEQAGVEVMLSTRVMAATTDGVRLKDGELISAGTVVCTIGIGASPVVESLGAPTSNGRLLTEPDMRIQGTTTAWAVGDCARIINDYDGLACPPTGQFAERQGRQVAANIVRGLAGLPTRQLHVRPLGHLCPIGRHNAVAEILGFRMSGFFAWFLWRSIYLFKLPSWSRRAKVGFDWAWDLVFSRDLVHVRTDRTERVSRAHYDPGDFVFRAGEPATSFYAIEKGEVEVLLPDESGQTERPIAVLGPGDFFGEMALLEERPRKASVRARSALEVVVIGRTVFSQVSSALGPLREVVASAVRRRSTHLWAHLPVVHDVLSRETLDRFIEPPPTVWLYPESTLSEAIDLFREHDLDYCCVLDADQRLQGILTRTDFLRALDTTTDDTGGIHRAPRVESIMVANPIAVTREESCLAVASTLRDHGLKGIPVIAARDSRHLVGYVRVDTMIQWVLRHLRDAGELRAAS